MSDAQGPDQLHDPNHSFDGIQEYDNNLPQWWLITLYICIAVAVAYAVWVHLGPGEVGRERWASQQAAAQAALAAQGGPLTEETLRKFLGDPQRIAAGKEVWIAKNCQSCHLNTGLGSVGTMLRDDHWRYGNTMENLVETFEKGRARRGMPAQGLSREQLINLTVYIVHWNVSEKANGQGLALIEDDQLAPIDYYKP